MKLSLFCKNLISQGKINEQSLKVGKYKFDYDVELDKTFTLFTLKNLKPGLSQGFIIEKILFDGFEINHWKDFLSFNMIDNPYVKNILLDRENDLRFNGEMKILLDSKKVFWNFWYSSKKKIGWIFNQNFHGCKNEDGCYVGEKNPHEENFLYLPYDKNIFYEKNKQTEYLILGCSITYGAGIEKNKIWPNKINKKNINLSCSSFGVDSIYITLKNALQEFTFDKVIILFPDLNRRLLRIKNYETIYSIPLTIRHEINSPAFLNNYYGITKKNLSLGIDKTKRKMCNDIDNIYSKKIMKKISNIFNVDKIFVSSWNRETYQLLPKYFKNILPFFDRIDLANDNDHPGAKSHEKWAISINNLI
jgi:hypothetical protein